MSYTTFDFYTNKYLGTSIPIEIFNFYSERARDEIDDFVNDDITTLYSNAIPDEIQKCNCRLAELLYKIDNNNDTITSEKVGEYQRTFAKEKSTTSSKQIQNILNRYLSKIGLMYRGL